MHKHKAAVGSGGKECPKPPVLRPWLLQQAVVRVQPPPAFTTSGMSKARKGSIHLRFMIYKSAVDGAIRKSQNDGAEIKRCDNVPGARAPARASLIPFCFSCLL